MRQKIDVPATDNDSVERPEKERAPRAKLLRLLKEPLGSSGRGPPDLE